MSGTVIEGWAGSTELTADVAVLNQRIVVGADDFYGLPGSSSL
jgi:hypothetical protein